MDEMRASLSWLKAELRFFEVVLLVLPELVTGRKLDDERPEVISNRNKFSYVKTLDVYPNCTCN